MTMASAVTSTEKPSKGRLRVWLHILKAQRGIEAQIRENLRQEFDTTLPRFDVMAALYRSQSGMKMSELSNALKVSNGNVTGIIDRLCKDEAVVRVPIEGDRRAMRVRLTDKGRQQFAQMAAAHEEWIDALLGDINPEEVDGMIAKFNDIENSVNNAKQEEKQ